MNSQLATVSMFVNRAYLFPALVMIYSAGKSLGTSARYVIGTFDNELNETDLRNIKHFASSLNVGIEILSISEEKLKSEIGQIDERSHFGYAAFGRLYMQRMIPEKHIYSDVDVIFLPGTKGLLDSLFKIPNIGFVPQASALRGSALDSNPLNSEFFSGFILWPDAHLRPKLKLQGAHALRTDFSTHDQALLNSIFGSEYTALDRAWCQLDNPSLRKSNYSSGIVHYFGNWKPWHLDEDIRGNCEAAACSWVHWFDQEDKAVQHFRKLNMDKWLIALQEQSKKTSSKNFRLLSHFVRMASKLKLESLFVRTISWVIRREIHLGH